jgi:hypothetical protein
MQIAAKSDLHHLTLFQRINLVGGQIRGQFPE